MDETLYLKAIQNVLLNTLQYFIRLCEKHNLRYWLIGGSCLGAVRHKGFIPWDDDIDVYMPYEDCLKLTTIMNKNKENDYYLLTIDTPNYYYPSMKICNAKTTLWEWDLFPMVIGIFIDIFPLFTTDWDDNKIFWAYTKYNKVAHRFLHTNRTFNPNILHEEIQRKYWRGVKSDLKWLLLSPLKQKFSKEFHNLEKKLNKSEGHKLIAYSDRAYGCQIYKKEWFMDYEREADFEGIKVRIPNGFDEYLTQIYGDYMQLPPEEKRHSNHGCSYLNLKEGLNMEEIRLRMKHGERIII